MFTHVFRSRCLEISPDLKNALRSSSIAPWAQVQAQAVPMMGAAMPVQAVAMPIQGPAPVYMQQPVMQQPVMATAMASPMR